MPKLSRSYSKTQIHRIVSQNRNNYNILPIPSNNPFPNHAANQYEVIYRNSSGFRRCLATIFVLFAELHHYQEQITCLPSVNAYLSASAINKLVYTVQQAIGCISNSLPNPNQARKRVGQLFELLIKLIIQEIGWVCESRTVSIPIPYYPDISISYELDLVFSRQHTIVDPETRFINPNEIGGSVKTTSKDRIDKIFLDKYLLTKLLGRNIPVVAIFLHDVQRSRIGNNDFGINSTFKSNHFLGYTIALNQLDGVYFVDTETVFSNRLRNYISDFQSFLVRDLWRLST